MYVHLSTDDDYPVLSTAPASDTDSIKNTSRVLAQAENDTSGEHGDISDTHKGGEGHDVSDAGAVDRIQPYENSGVFSETSTRDDSGEDDGTDLLSILLGEGK